MRRLIKVTLFCLVLSSPLLASEFAFGGIIQPIILGDYNGDGASDIIWRADFGYVFLRQMNGGIIGSDSFISDSRSDWTIVGSGDFNGDGKADILWRSISGDVAVWLMDGVSITKSSTIANIWTGWTIAGTGDFNGDGKADILWRSISGDVAVWLMDGVSITSASTIANIWPGWTIVGTGDFNGDGKADILWRTAPEWIFPFGPVQSHVTIWLMDGTALLTHLDFEIVEEEIC